MDENKYINIIAAYAKNRQDLAVINKDINYLVNPIPFRTLEDFDHIDITKYRDLFYNDNSETDEYIRPEWEGWKHCLDCSGEDYDDSEYELAVLLDKKKLVNSEAGQIKRNICTIGRSILKNHAGLGTKKPE